MNWWVKSLCYRIVWKVESIGKVKIQTLQGQKTEE